MNEPTKTYNVSLIETVNKQAGSSRQVCAEFDWWLQDCSAAAVNKNKEEHVHLFILIQSLTDFSGNK